MTTDIEYRTYFSLDKPVHDKEIVQNFLNEDMVYYLHQDSRVTCANAVLSIKWYIVTPQNGIIHIIANRPLLSNELQQLSKFIASQCRDGVGSALFDWLNVSINTAKDTYDLEEVGGI